MEELLIKATAENWDAAQMREGAAAAGVPEKKMGKLLKKWRERSGSIRDELARASGSTPGLENFAWRIDVRSAAMSSEVEIGAPTSVFEVRNKQGGSALFELSVEELQSFSATLDDIEAALSSRTT